MRVRRNVAQTSKSAVSRASQPASRCQELNAGKFPAPADLEIGDWLARARSLGPADLSRFPSGSSQQVWKPALHRVPDNWCQKSP